MSYILDALRRADAERERGAVPGLHAQQFTLSSDADEGAGTGSRKLLYVSVGLGLALVAALAWKLLGSEPAQPVQVPIQAPIAASPLPAPALARPSIGATTGLPTAIPAPSPAAPMPSAAGTVAAMPPPLSAATRSARAPASGPGPRPAPLAAAAVNTAPPANRLYTQAELPEEIRRGLPKLSVGGASYSADAASRMVIINGQVLHEGDKIGNGLVLQQIKLKAAVLSSKGYRFEITY